MSSKSFWTGIAVLAAGLIFVTGGGAATTTTVTLTVNSTADSTTPCTVANHKSAGTCTLRGAILAADSFGHDNTMFVIKLAAKTYHLNKGTLDVAAATANTGNLVEIVGVAGKHGPASIIDGSGNARPSSVFIIESPTQMSNVVIKGGTGNAGYACYASFAGCGGGIFVDSALALQHSVVRNNTACASYTGKVCTGQFVYGGGIYVPDDAGRQLLTLDKTTVTHNVAYGGGGIYNEGYPATVLIMSSHIDKNTACSAFSGRICTDNGFGGGLANDGEQITLDHSTVNGNVAGSTAYDVGQGGGIYQGNDNMQLNHTTVNGNVAGFEGGGLHVNDGNVDLVDSVVSHNTAGSYGGGMELQSLASFKNTTFSSNTAGGTFECTLTGTPSCKHTIKATTGTCATLYPSATKCTAFDGYGGAIYSDGDYPEFISSTITKNLAASIKGDAVDCNGGQGGGVYTQWTLTAVAGTKFTGNTADCGGGIYNYFNPPSTVETFALSNSTISGNTALEDGGGIWTGGPGSATLYRTTITGNHAGRRTGGVWDDQLGSVLLGGGNKITTNTSPHACKNLRYPCR